MVESDTIVVSNSTAEEKPNERRIYWKPPKNPNGFVLAYWAKLVRDDESVRISDFHFEFILWHFRLHWNNANRMKNSK